MYKEVSRWLMQTGIPVSTTFIRIRLESHPDYPSLTAVQDTLEEIGVEANAYETTFDVLGEAKKPFLAHLNIGEGDIRCFQDITIAEKEFPGFQQRWSGVVMLIDKIGVDNSAEHKKQLLKDRNNSAFLQLSAGLLLFIILSVLFFSFSLKALIILPNLAALYISWLIAQKEFGISNKVSEMICSMAKQSRCEAVLFSRGARLFSWLTWGDVGIAYFSSVLIFLVVALLGGWPEFMSCFYLLSFAGAVFPLYSVYYQWKKVKQWCMLCLAIVGVLLINSIAGLLLIELGNFQWSTLIYPAMIFSCTTVLTLSVWQLFKSLYAQSLRAVDNEIRALRLKRNPDIFNALMAQQEFNPINMPEPDEPIRFGNPDAPYQIVMACNPYCGPCAKAHEAIDRLFMQYEEKLSITIRFALFNTDPDLSVTKAVNGLLFRVNKTKNPQKVINEWYKNYTSDIENSVIDSPYNDISIEKYHNWVKKITLKSTPTLYVNGKILDQYYTWVDIIGLISFQLKEI